MNRNPGHTFRYKNCMFTFLKWKTNIICKSVVKPNHVDHLTLLPSCAVSWISSRGWIWYFRPESLWMKLVQRIDCFQACPPWKTLSFVFLSLLCIKLNLNFFIQGFDFGTLLPNCGWKRKWRVTWWEILSADVWYETDRFLVKCMLLRLNENFVWHIRYTELIYADKTSTAGRTRYNLATPV